MDLKKEVAMTARIEHAKEDGYEIGIKHMDSTVTD
jgi:hypothetical protein